MSRAEQKALDKLLELIKDGVEYPDAIWRATQYVGRFGSKLSSERLGELYDEHCACERHIDRVNRPEDVQADRIEQARERDQRDERFGNW